jgi:hypothetical protein
MKPAPHGQVPVRRDFARRIFWSTHPICQLCAIAHGEWERGQFFREGAFSLRQLIEFTEQLPREIFLRLSAR